MSDLLGEAAVPLVTYGYTEDEGQSLTFWLDAWPNDRASMHFGGRSRGWFRIYGDCPQSWTPLIMEAWNAMQVGLDVSHYATHKLNVERWARTKLEALVSA